MVTKEKDRTVLLPKNHTGIKEWWRFHSLYPLYALDWC